MGWHEVTLSTRIRASPERVWEVLTDPRSYPKWLKHAQEVDAPARPFKVGYRFRIKTRTTNHRYEAQLEVTEVEPGRRLTWRSVETLMDGRPFAHVEDLTTSFTIEAAANSTRVHIRGGFEAKSLKARLGAPLILRSFVRPELEKTIDELERYCR